MRSGRHWGPVRGSPFIPLFARSLASPAPDVSDRTAQRILDAALAEAAAQGLHGLTTEGVARRAGVNRVTVYRRFGDREALLAALAAREGHRMATALTEATATIEDPDERFVEGFTAAIRLAREHPIIARTARHEPEALVAAGLADDAALLRIGAAFMAAAVRHAQRQGRALHLDPDAAGETAARLFAAFVLLPAGGINLHDDDATRAYARDTLVPMLLGPPQTPPPRKRR